MRRVEAEPDHLVPAKSSRGNAVYVRRTADDLESKSKSDKYKINEEEKKATEEWSEQI